MQLHLGCAKTEEARACYGWYSTSTRITVPKPLTWPLLEWFHFIWISRNISSLLFPQSFHFLTSPFLSTWQNCHSLVSSLTMWQNCVFMPEHGEKFAEGTHTLSAISNMSGWACVAVDECSPAAGIMHSSFLMTYAHYKSLAVPSLIILFNFLKFFFF